MVACAGRTFGEGLLAFPRGHLGGRLGRGVDGLGPGRGVDDSAEHVRAVGHFPVGGPSNRVQ
jgi:hypothetical protein